MAEAPPFDGSTYRRTVLAPLRRAAPSAVEDLFWLGDVPREVEDEAQIAARLKATKAFLHKERSRPRQADVAAAVLREWPRVEGVLRDQAARASLRSRLAGAEPGVEVVGGAGLAGAGVGSPGALAGPDGGGGFDPAARRRRQVATALGELARLRDEPELAEDLFAFLGLPVTATAEMLRTRVERVADVNRKRRPDRERSLVDELLMHSRELLVDGNPAAYRAGLAADAEAPEAASGLPSAPESSVDRATPPEPPATIDTSRPPMPAARIDYTRRPRPAPEADPPAPPRADGPAPRVVGLALTREAQGGLRVTWQWPAGITEAFVATGVGSGPHAPGVGRKVTNTKYEIDGGVLLNGVAPGELVTVHTGYRDAAGTLHWNDATMVAGAVAP